MLICCLNKTLVFQREQTDLYFFKWQCVKNLISLGLPRGPSKIFFTCKLFDKRDKFQFFIVRMVHLSSNIPSFFYLFSSFDNGWSSCKFATIVGSRTLPKQMKTIDFISKTVALMIIWWALQGKKKVLW